MVTVYIGLGSNMGNRRANLQAAVNMLRELPGLQVTAIAPLYETEPWGLKEQEPFLNTVVQVETAYSPRELLSRLQGIENRLGRVRKEKWGPRTVDLDILLYGHEVVNEPDLQIPHPYLLQRAFVLVPLLDLDNGLTMPDGRFLRDFLPAVAEQKVNKISEYLV